MTDRTHQPAEQPRDPTSVLVVDDEPMLRSAMEVMLSRLGSVDAKDSVAAAIAHLESGRPVDLILCDLMMPGRGGSDLHSWLKQHRPELLDRVLYVTGGAFTPAAQRFLEREQPRTLYKPFSRQELLEFAHTILGNSARRPPVDDPQ